MAMASRSRRLTQLWSVSGLRRSHGGVSAAAGRLVPRGVGRDLRERVPECGRERRQGSQRDKSGGTKSWRLQDRFSSDSHRLAVNGSSSLERMKAFALGDRSQICESGLNEGEREQSEPVPFMTDDFCDHRGMQIVFLGTSSSMPTLSRNTSCVALRLDGTIYMFDCGEGVQRQLHRTPFRHRTIDNIFITHMHGDHNFSLSFRYLDFQEGLLCMIGMTAPSTRRPVEIYGPQGLRDWIRTTLKLSHARVPNKYVVHELVLQEGKRKRGSSRKGWNTSENNHEDELSGKDIFCSQVDGLWHVHADRKYKVVAGLLKHAIPCWGYVVEEQPKTGRFDVDRATKAGVSPGPMYAKLQKGHSVVLEDGRTVHPSDVLGPPRKGRKAVILGDTSDSRSLLVAAKGADVVVHEATVLEQEAELASHRGHSTASTAGKFAKMIEAKSLVLTHFSGKLEGSLYGTSGKGTIADLVWAAKRTFGKPSVMAAYDLAAVTVVGNLDQPLPTQ